jgi:hypothetical protein
MKSVEDHVMKDGDITAYEAEWLRKTFFADKRIDAREWRLIQDLHKKAKKKAPEFDQLYADCEAAVKRAKARAKAKANK